MAPKTLTPEHVVPGWRKATERGIWQDPKGLTLSQAMAALFSPLPAKADLYLARDVDGTIIERGRQTVAAPRFVPIRYVSSAVDVLEWAIIRPGEPAKIWRHEDEPSIEWSISGASDRPCEMSTRSVSQPNGGPQSVSVVMVKWPILLDAAPASKYSYSDLQMVNAESKARAVAAVESLPIVPSFVEFGGSRGPAQMIALYRLVEDITPEWADSIELGLANRFGGISKEQRASQPRVNYQGIDEKQFGYGTAMMRAAQALSQTPQDVTWIPLPGTGRAECQVVPRLMSDVVPVGDPVRVEDLAAVLE